MIRAHIHEARDASMTQRRSTLPALGAAAAVVALLVSGCARLEVEELPAERAAPASEAPLWKHVTGRHPDDWFYLLNTGEEALDWRLRMIDSAHESIDLETFLWKPDESGRQILAHVFAAADRGVKVRFLLDDALTLHEDLALHAIDEHPNIALRLYNPLQNRSGNAVWRQLFNAGEFARVNHRMHNKVLVVDGRAVLVGGRNLADEYFGLHDRMNFRDMEVIAAGASVPRVVEHFDAFWNSGWAFPLADVVAAPPDSPSLDDARAELAANTPTPTPPDLAALEARWRAIANAGYPGRAEFYFDRPARDDPGAPDEMPDELAGELLRLIDDARSEVVLVSAYLVPTPELEAAIERAEARGVQVRVLTNSLRSNNHLAAHAAYRGYIDRLLTHGADLHEVRAEAADRALYMREPVTGKELGLHAKVLLIDDDTVFIGTANLDPRSLVINTEVGLVIESASLSRALEAELAVDFEPRNAWAVRRSDDGRLIWVGDDQVLTREPAESGIQRIEDWFVGLLPIDRQM